MKKTSTRLADGRELIYFDLRDDIVRDAVDRRPLERTVTTSEIRRDVLLGDSVAIASHRQGRTYHPPADECPVSPSGISVTSEPANRNGVSDQRSTGRLAMVTSAAKNAVHRHAPAVSMRSAVDQMVAGLRNWVTE